MRWKLAGAAASILFLAAADAPAPILRDLIWTDPAADRARVLTRAPGECLAGEGELAVETGRALFRSRTLLGGPAARVGLACDSCHANGRANAHFLLPELTDRAGAADVTSEWASKVRGDGVMNPRPIPDLAGVAARATFGADRDPSLQHFVESVVEEEFQGAPLSPGMRAALLAYLGALDPAACPAQETPIRAAALASDVRRAFAAARAQAAAGDAPTATAALLATQDALARIVERLPPRMRRERGALEALARELGAAREDLGALNAISWLARFDAVARRIERRARRTYFDEATLRAALRP